MINKTPFEFIPLLLALLTLGAHADESARLNDVIALLRTNLPGVTEAQMEDAAIAGLAAELRPRVVFEKALTNAAGIQTALSSTILGEFASLRVVRVAIGLDASLSKSIKSLEATNKLKGLILDLRFARGDDYAAAGSAASVFISQQRPLLSWTGGSAKSTANADAVSLPLVILVNRETSGAAEALAAVLRETQSGLLIGNRTAGQGVTYKEFPLGRGRILKIAGPPVEIPGKGALPPKGLVPDIAVDVPIDLERAYYADPYLVSQTGSAPRNLVNSALLDEEDLAASNHRLNEAELVRLQKQGITPEEATPTETNSPRRLNEAELVRERRGGIAAPETARPHVLTDPALSRALDLLKGLAVVRAKPA